MLLKTKSTKLFYYKQRCTFEMMFVPKPSIKKKKFKQREILMCDLAMPAISGFCMLALKYVNKVYKMCKDNCFTQIQHLSFHNLVNC